MYTRAVLSIFFLCLVVFSFSLPLLFSFLLFPCVSFCVLFSRGGRRGVAPEESEETASVSNSQLYTQQKQQLDAQDAKLDGILEGVTKLKVMSQDINQELNLHEHLLTELDGAVESTDARIQRNTKRIGLIQESSGGWCGLIIMFVLFVIIVLLLSTNYGCHVFKPSAC
jgi:syntaxin 8